MNKLFLKNKHFSHFSGPTKSLKNPFITGPTGLKNSSKYTFITGSVGPTGPTGPTGPVGPITSNNILDNYKKNSFILKGNNGFNFIADLENINANNIPSPYISFNTVNPTDNFTSSLELNDGLSKIGFHMDQSENGDDHSTYLSVKENNNESILDSTSLKFKDHTDKNSSIYNKDGVIITNNNNSVVLKVDSLTFTDSKSNTASISQLNNQIVFNNTSHIDSGNKIIDNNLTTSTILFTSPYPDNYIPNVFLQQYNNNNIKPQTLLVTNITNINFTWRSENENVGTIMWLAF